MRVDTQTIARVVGLHADGVVHNKKKSFLTQVRSQEMTARNSSMLKAVEWGQV
jgi:hypothetical protein